MVRTRATFVLDICHYSADNEQQHQPQPVDREMNTGEVVSAIGLYFCLGGDHYSELWSDPSFIKYLSIAKINCGTLIFVMPPNSSVYWQLWIRRYLGGDSDIGFVMQGWISKNGGSSWRSNVGARSVMLIFINRRSHEGSASFSTIRHTKLETCQKPHSTGCFFTEPLFYW